MRIGKKKKNSGNPNPKPPPVETRFKKGQSGNPKGKPPLPPEIKEARLLIKQANERVVNKLVASGRYEELLELGLINTIEAGKVDGLKFINDYVGNKPIDKTEISGDLNVDLYANLTKEELKKELDKFGLSEKLFDK